MTAEFQKTVADRVVKVPVTPETPLPVRNYDDAGAAAPAGSSADPSYSRSQTYGVPVSKTRPADTSAYTANDIVGNATGSTAAWTFPAIAPGAGEIYITSAALEVDLAAVPSGMTSFVLYLYNITPPSALGDNAAFDLPSGDRASFIGSVDLGTPVDLGSTLYVRTDNLNIPVSALGTSIFGYLVTVGAYTPASETVYKITLHTAVL